MAIRIDGKAIAAELRAQMKAQVSQMEEDGVTPGLAVVLVGEDPASHTYVRNKKRACEETGIYSEVHTLPASFGQAALLDLIAQLNARPDIDGILVQSPLPEGYDEQAVVNAIAPDKDVDAFHPENVGKLSLGEAAFLPCTPAGILTLLRHEGISVAGKRCVVVGRSNIVGRPMAMLLLQADGTVTVCHSKTQNLPAVTREADILIAAIGKPKFFTADMVKPGAVVIDVGMDRDEAGKLCGDVDFASVEPVASYITPVPGGVGPMTIAMLLQNTLTAARLHNHLPASGKQGS